MQNLVVRPISGKGKRFRIVTGERRYRALKLLAEHGELDDGYTVPVEIKDRLSKDESLRLATVENLQRLNLTPLEETDAFTKLVRKGDGLEDVAAQTDLSATTIRRRLALNVLCDEARAALAEGELTLSQAEALTLGDHGAQRRILEEIGRGYQTLDTDDIKATLLDDRPTVADAVFSVERYTGTVTTDLFGEEEESYSTMPSSSLNCSVRPSSSLPPIMPRARRGSRSRTTTASRLGSMTKPRKGSRAASSSTSHPPARSKSARD